MAIKLLIFLLILLCSFNTIESDNGCLKMDIIILIDTSYSVHGYEYFIADAYEAFIKRFNLSEDGIMIGGYIFNSIVYEISNLTTNKSELMYGGEFIRTYAADGGTNLLRGLEVVSSRFSSNGRSGVPKSLIIITDGLPNSHIPCKNFVNDLKKQYPELTIYGIHVADNGGEDYLISISDFYVSTSYDILVDELEKLDMCF